jgi:histidinol phosphatase-like enzyme
MTIGCDVDGTILNYGSNAPEIQYNEAILGLLSDEPIVLISNQGGVAFHSSNPARYPAPEQVARRLQAAAAWLTDHGHVVAAIAVCTYHPKASWWQIQEATTKLAAANAEGCWPIHIYTGASARKPKPLMLYLLKLSAYYGDGDEDEQAAQAAGIPFVRVSRFNPEE